MTKSKFSLVLLISLFILIVGCRKEDPIMDEPIEPLQPLEPIGLVDTTLLVDVGGYGLFTETKGQGPITLMIENGLGGFLNEWKPIIFDSLSLENQVIIYNRAGYLPSQYAPDSIGRDISQLAKELKIVIDSVAQNENIVLVGHSLGGPIIRSFVSQFPGKAIAMLFVDPAHEGDYTASSISAFQDSLLNQVIPNIPQTQYLRDEIEALTTNWALQNALPNLPNIPITVLTAMSLIEPDGFVYTPEERQIWYDLHESLGVGVDDFTHLSSDEVSHYIHEDDPDMVIDALNDLID